MLRVTSLCGLLLTTGCANSPQATATNPVTPDGFDSGNSQVWNRSAGYSVHVLNGESLSAQEVGINGLRIDTTSVHSIESSVQAIVDAPSDDTVVELAAAPASVTPDLTVNYTGATTAVKLRTGTRRGPKGLGICSKWPRPMSSRERSLNSDCVLLPSRCTQPFRSPTTTSRLSFHL